jgi:PAS domain S-box-containing protein
MADDLASGIQPRGTSLRQLLEGLKPHDHLCLLYESPQERLAAAVPFIAIGLKRNEKCIYIVDISTAEDVRKHLADEGVDIATAERSGQLSILHESTTYTKGGVFDPDRMIALLIDEAKKALSQGYTALRVTGEMTWVLRNLPGSERLLEYEARLNGEFFPKYSATAICQYDRWKFDFEILKGVIVTHPLLIRGDRVYHNFYYVPPQEFLSGKLAEVEIKHWLNNLEREQQVQSSLRQSEHRYRTLTEQSLLGVLVVAKGFRIVYANRVIAEITGYSVDELLSLPPEKVQALVHPQDRAMVWGRFQRRLAGEDVPPHYEYCGIRKDGRVRWLEMHATAIEYDGEPAILAAITDITERKKLEKDLHDSESRYRRLFEAFQDGILILDGETGEVIDANHFILNRLRYAMVELKGKRLWELGFFEDTEASKTAFKELKEKGYVRYEHLPLRTKDGQRVDTEFISNAYEVDGQKFFQCNIRDITERKRSQEMYETILRTTIDGFWLADMEGRFLEVNDAYCRLTGYSREELLRMTIRDVEAIETPEETSRRIQKIQQVGYDRFESRHRCKDGRVVDVEVSVSYLPGDTGRMVVFVRDITGRKMAMEAIRLSEERYRSVVENANEAISVVQNGIIKLANAKVTEITGYTIEELNAMPRGSTIHPDDRDRVIGYHEQRLRGEDVPNTYELRIIDKQGNLKWLERHVALITWEGKPAGLVLDTDVTERKQAERALQESEERYRLIAENTRDVIITADMDLKVTYISPSVRYLSDRTPEEVLATGLDKLLTPASLKEATKVLREELERARTQPVEPGRSRTLEMEVIRKDGSTLWAEARVSFLRNAEGQPVGLIGMLRDITERKRAEEERKQLELKAQIASRLASVGEMAAGVAHEINNPLTGIVGYAQLLASRQDLPEDVKKDLKIVNDGAQRVAGIVQRLLTFARQVKPERRQVNINQLIESTLALRTYSLRTSNIEVTTRLDSYLPDTIADPGQIQQVLLNLIVNAETAMKEVHRKRRLTITTRKADSIVEIKVKDNGHGIKPEIMDRIFDPFFTTRPAGEGTGLGLSLCYGIVTEHNGRIYAESKPGRGATFVVELPIVSEVAQPVQMPIEFRQKLTGSRILVVDDEPVIRDFINQVLSWEGCEVDTAASAEEALQKIASQQYNLLLLDIKMPGMDGIEFYNRVKRLGRSLARRVVFITGDVISHGTERFLTENKLPHIEKPFTATQLIDKLGRTLRAGR